MPYVAPGAAFTNSLEDTMLAQAAAQRQSVLDQQAARRAQDEHEEAQNALQEKRAEALSKVEDKERSQIEREVTSMVPGDIPDAALIARARKYHIPLPTTTAVPATETPEAPVAPLKVIQTMGGETPAPPPPVAQPIRFAGTPVQRMKEKETSELKDRQAKLAAELSGVTDRKVAVEKAIAAGVPYAQVDDVLNAFMGPKQTLPASAQEYEYAKSNGYKGSYTQYQNDDANRKEKATGAGSAAASARADTRRDSNYKSALTELEAATKPIAGQLQSIEDLGIMINERTPQADALIAPMVLKATISGTGSGFRMTQAEINQVLGAGSKWQALERSLKKWETDPSKALSVTDDQRDQLRSLAKAIRRKAHEKLVSMTKARHDLDDAPDGSAGVDAIHRIMTKVKDDIYSGETAEEAAAPKLSAAELIKKYGTGAK